MAPRQPVRGVLEELSGYGYHQLYTKEGWRINSCWIPYRPSSCAVDTILILDDDLGFVWWLGEVVAAAGYQAIPAPSVAEGERLLSGLRLAINLLIVNPAMPGAAGFIDKCRRAQKNLRVLAAVGETEGSEALFDHADAVGRKPAEVNDRSASEWVRAIKRVLGPRLVKH